MTYSGRMHWRTKTGDEVSAQLGALETKDITQQAWRTALDPKGEWIQSVLSAEIGRASCRERETITGARGPQNAGQRGKQGEKDNRNTGEESKGKKTRKY